MKYHSEKILCIKSEKLFERGKWEGLKSDDLDYYKRLILDNKEFRPRNDLETDTSYKQVIAQVILRNDNKYFLHKQVDCGEKRLNGLCPLFIGGHIEEFDQDSHNDIIETALLRELDEEVVLNTSIVNKEFLGLVYVYANEPTIVNKVHFGLVYIFDLKGQGVHVKEDGLEDIGFVTLNYLKENEKNLTPWSRLIIKFL